MKADEMPFRIVRLLAVITGLTSVVLFSAAQANAAGVWTVKAGSAAPGTTVHITGRQLANTTRIRFIDATIGGVATVECYKGTAPGNTTVGTHASGAAIGHIFGANTTWTYCPGPLAAEGMAVNITGSGTWNLNARSFAAPVVNASISNIKITFVDPGICVWTLTGTVAATYNNSTHVLTIPGKQATLTVSHAACLGVINNGDKMKFEAKYRLTAGRAAFDPITITQG